jgi:hypothetical protein
VATIFNILSPTFVICRLWTEIEGAKDVAGPKLAKARAAANICDWNFMLNGKYREEDADAHKI